MLGAFNSFKEEEEEEEEENGEGVSSQSVFEWRVLILDDVTTKVVSSAVGMADLMAERSITSVESILNLANRNQKGKRYILFLQQTRKRYER